MNQLKLELERRKSQTQRILERIRKGGATNVDLALIGTRYTERVRELRKEGHHILAIYDRPGLWRYVYRDFTPPPDGEEETEPRKEYEDTY